MNSIYDKLVPQLKISIYLYTEIAMLYNIKKINFVFNLKRCVISGGH
jgi:hypothetical protein